VVEWRVRFGRFGLERCVVLLRKGKKCYKNKSGWSGMSWK